MKVSVENKVKLMLEELLQVDQSEMTPAANLREDLGADSMDIVEIVMLVEEGFDIQVSDADAEKLKTVDDIYKLVEKSGVALAVPKA